MASSNRHWPSMFKSKPCNSHHQWQHDINPSLMSSSGCHRPPYTSVNSGCEERSPEPKPRWNPKPEQIRILEAIFNSGMVNPPRDEIRKIRVQLQEYGQVGDANVFYWFQNRKSRSKHKLRHLQNSSSSSSSTKSHQNPSPVPSSSSSSSDKSSPNIATGFSNVTAGCTDHQALNISSPTASVNNNYTSATFFQVTANNNNVNNIPDHHQFLASDQPFFFPANYQSTGTGGNSHSTVSSSTNSNFGQGFCFPELLNPVHHHDEQQNTGNINSMMGPCTSLLLSEIMNHGGSKKHHDHDEEGNDNKVLMMMKMEPHLNYSSTTPPSSTHPTTNVVVSSPHATTTCALSAAALSPVNQVQGAGVGEEGVMGPRGGAKTTVFINEVAFEVSTGPFNVREAFGDDAVLIHSYGQPVLTNEWGITLHSLQHGAFYYLI